MVEYIYLCHHIHLHSCCGRTWMALADGAYVCDLNYLAVTHICKLK